MTETINNEQDLTKSSSEEMSEANEESIAKADKCPTCGQSMPMKKAEDADEMEKAADEPESKEEAAKETPEDEKKEMKKSLWDGSFSPNIKRGL